MSILKRIRSYRKYKNTFNELNRLSDRELHDIGIQRCDIPYIAKFKN